MLNLINLFDAKSGQFQYMSFGQDTRIQPIPTTVTASSPVTGYNITPITQPNFQRFLRDDLRSRWQIQLGPGSASSSNAVGYSQSPGCFGGPGFFDVDGCQLPNSHSELQLPNQGLKRQRASSEGSLTRPTASSR